GEFAMERLRCVPCNPSDAADDSEGVARADRSARAGSLRYESLPARCNELRWRIPCRNQTHGGGGVDAFNCEVDEDGLERLLLADEAFAAPLDPGDARRWDRDGGTDQHAEQRPRQPTSTGVG